MTYKKGLIMGVYFEKFFGRYLRPKNCKLYSFCHGWLLTFQQKYYTFIIKHTNKDTCDSSLCWVNNILNIILQFLYRVAGKHYVKRVSRIFSLNFEI